MVSFDNQNFTYSGTIANPARQGTLMSALPNNADPDTVNMLQIDLTESFGVLSGDATHADADNDRTLCLVTAPFTSVCPGVGEFLDYGASAVGGTSNQFTLTYLRRGRIGTTSAAWPVGSFFTRVDFTPFVSGPNALSLLAYNLPAKYVGKPLYLQFLSFNVFGSMQQALGSVPTYTYTPTGAGYGTGPGGVPSTPTGLMTIPGAGVVTDSWNANSVADNVTEYRVYRATGLNRLFSSAVLIASVGTALTFSDVGLTAASNWTYFLVASNAVGDSPPTAGVNATTFAAASPGTNWYQSLSWGGKLTDLVIDSWDGNYELFDIQAPVALTFSSNFAGSPTPGCEVAPVTAVTLTFQTIHAGVATTVGTLTVAGGSTTGAFNVASGFTLPPGDRIRCYAPVGVDTTLTGLFGTIVASQGAVGSSNVRVDQAGNTRTTMAGDTRIVQ
jgi:hypothetical protein